MSQLRRRRVLGLLALPLLVVVVVAMMMAWAQPTGPPEVQATGTTTFDQVAQDVGIAPLLDETGGVTTNATIDGAVIDVTSEDGITFSAIPIVGDGLSVSEITLIATIGAIAILLGTATITDLDYVRTRTRRRRRLDIPIASIAMTNGTPTDTPTRRSKHSRTMGRTALNSSGAGILSVLQFGQTRVTATSRTRQAKTTRTSVPA